MRAALQSVARLAVRFFPDQPASPSAQFEAIEAEMLNRPQIEAPVTHRFGPGVYLRECEMPAGSEMLGHEHRTAHWNIVLTGRARVFVLGAWHIVKAGDVFLSPAGSRKFGVIEETMRFLTIHPTDETDLAALETALVRKTETFRAHEIVRSIETGKAEVRA